jgi:hypothetical protein
MKLNAKTRLFLILFGLGMLGVLSFLLVDLNALVALLPVPAGTNLPPAIKVLSLIQPTLIVAVAVLLGVALSPKVGLSAPLAESINSGARSFTFVKSQLISGLLGGLVGAASILLIFAVFKTLLSTDMLVRIQQFGKLLPMPTRLLYGGIAEELLLRWGFMTLLVWAGWRVFQKRLARPTSACFVVAILLSAFVFGAGHLPVAFMLFPQPTISLVVFVILANSAFGVVAGSLYWKYGLESAMVAHMIVHLLLAAASYAGAYF